MSDADDARGVTPLAPGRPGRCARGHHARLHGCTHAMRRHGGADGRAARRTRAETRCSVGSTRRARALAELHVVQRAPAPPPARCTQSTAVRYTCAQRERAPRDSCAAFLHVEHRLVDLVCVSTNAGACASDLLFWAQEQQVNPSTVFISAAATSAARFTGLCRRAGFLCEHCPEGQPACMH